MREGLEYPRHAARASAPRRGWPGLLRRPQREDAISERQDLHGEELAPRWSLPSGGRAAHRRVGGRHPGTRAMSAARGSLDERKARV